MIPKGIIASIDLNEYANKIKLSFHQEETNKRGVHDRL